VHKVELSLTSSFVVIVIIRMCLCVGVYKVLSSRGFSIVSSDSFCEVNRANPTRLRVRESWYDFFAKELL
jgi:hypothetical protein